MLIGRSKQKPNLEQIRRIKETLRTALALGDDAMVTVTQLACLEEDCAPLETVIGVLRPGLPQLQYKIHNAIDAVTANDLVLACEAWGHAAPNTVIEQLFKES